MVHRRDFLRSVSGGALCGISGARAAAARRPNIIVILADDLGSADLGFRGCKDIPTPNVDRLARGGVQFSNAYISHPFCSPTRSGLMTGRYQQRYGHENNPRYDPQDNLAGLPVSEVTLPQTLAATGYATGLIGKWHLGAAPQFHPMKRGFQEWFGFIGGGHHYFDTQLEGRPPEYLVPMERNGKPERLQGYLTDVLSGEAASFVRRHAKDPFFLYLAYNAPHTPQHVTERYLDRFRHISDPVRQKYAAMVSAMDDGIGRVLAAVSDLKLDSDTLIFFFSDNGGPVPVNGSRNDPFRGAKGQVYEGGIRTPLIARWSGRLPAGSTYSQPVISLDIFPTAVAAAGAALLPGKKLDGVNVLPHLLGKTKRPPHERLFWRTGGGASFAVREGRHKLVKIGAEAPHLFDLEADPAETRDLAAETPDIMNRLEAARVNWNRELVPPIFESPRPAGKGKKA